MWMFVCLALRRVDEPVDDGFQQPQEQGTRHEYTARRE